MTVSEPERLDPHHVGQGAHLFQHLFAGGLVDLDQGDGVAAGRAAAQVERRDVDAGVAQGRAQGADDPGLVVVGDEQHARRRPGSSTDPETLPAIPCPSDGGILIWQEAVYVPDATRQACRCPNRRLKPRAHKIKLSTSLKY